MNVLFFFSVLPELYAALGKQLQKDGTASSLSGIVFGVDQTSALQKQGFAATDIVAFAEYLERGFGRRREADEVALRTWERQHGVLLNLMIACDRRYNSIDRATALRVAELCIECVADALEGARPDVIISQGIDCLLSYVLYCEARRRGIPLLITYAAPLPGRVAIYSNPHNHWERVDAIFAERVHRPLTADQRARAEALRQQYVGRAITPSYVGNYQLKPWAPARVRRDLATVRLLLARAWSERQHTLNPTYEGGLITVAARRVGKDVRRVFLKRHLNALPRFGESYVLFAMQVEPEVSTSVFAPYCTDQVGVVEDIARGLPVDTVLYVKEHPVMMGRRSVKDYQRLKRVPNVRLLAAGLSTSHLISGAAAVVVITSTVGWEAVVQDRPVIVLGNVWYDGCGLVEKVRAVSEGPDALERALTAPRAATSG